MCSCKQNPCVCCPPKKTSGIKGVFNKYAPRLCLAGIMCGAHAVHLAGVAAVLGSTASLGTAFGLAVSGAIFGGWHLWRGKKADKGEKRFMIASTAVSVALSFAMDHGDRHNHHHTPIQACPVPAYVSPGDQWFEKQDSATQATVSRNALLTNQNLETYLDGLCVKTPVIKPLVVSPP